MKGALFVAWAGSIALVTWRSVSGKGRAPLPSEMAATVVVFGTLSLMPDSWSPIPAALGFGFDIAALLNLFDPTDPLNRPAAKQRTQQIQSAGQNIATGGVVR